MQNTVCCAGHVMRVWKPTGDQLITDMLAGSLDAVVAYLVDGILLHPGDSFTLPGRAVDVGASPC